MISFKKAIQPKKTLCDERYSDMWHTVIEAQIRLMDCVYESIAKNAVVDLYPDGPDKTVAIETAAKGRLALRAAVGNFDMRRQELLDYYRLNSSRMEVCHTWYPSRWLTSHEYVEKAYERYFRRD